VAAVLHASGAVAQVPAQAQAPTASSAGDQLEEVVVTARKREEVIQKTPVAITAFSAKDLAEKQVQQVNDLQQTTPSLQIQKTGTSPLGIFLSMRGQVQTAASVFDEPSVGLYVDDVLDGGRLVSSLLNVVDIERVEVLKGPQGTLYGRNTTGGAIKLVTKLPTNEFEAQLTLGLGNYDRHVVDAIVNVPIIQDKLALRLIGVLDQHSGYSHDVNNNNDMDAKDQHGVRGALKFDPTDDLDIVLRGNFGFGRDGGAFPQSRYLLPGLNNAALNIEVVSGLLPLATAGLAVRGDANARAQATALLPQVAALFAAQAAAPRDKAALFKGQAVGDRGQEESGSVTIKYDLEPVTIKSITAFQRFNRKTTQSTLGSPFAVAYNNQESGGNVLTQELQVTGIGLDDRLSYAAGIYYYYATTYDFRPQRTFPQFLTPLGFTPLIVNNHNNFTAESPAAYGQATYALTPDVHFTAGVRWTTEARTAFNNSVSIANSGVATCVSPLPATSATPLSQCFASAKQSNRNVSYTVGLDWSPTDDLLLYAKTSRGFKSGGLNNFPQPNIFIQPFAPEIVTDYEGGVKSQWLDNRLRVNADIYHSDYDNIQRSVSRVFGAITGSFIQNAASSTIDGAEFEVEAVPVRGLNLGATAAYTYPKYLRYTQPTQNLAVYPSGIQDLSSQKFQGLSRWTYSLSAGYDYPTEIGDLHTEVDWTYRSKNDLFVADSFPGTSATAGAFISPESARTQSGYGLLNASMSLDIERYDAKITIWGKNILDKVYFQDGISLVNAGLGQTVGYYGDPATFGVDLTKRF